MQLSVVTKKTLADFSNPKLVVAYLVPFAGIGALIVTGFTGTMSEDIASLPLRYQEEALAAAVNQLAFVWGAGFPVMVLGAVLSANTLAREAERGTLRILLSKPVRRWEVLAGTFLSVFAFSTAIAIAGILLVSVALVYASGVSPLALEGGLVRFLPGAVAFGVVVSFAVAALGTALSVFTGSRLRTVLGVLVLPALFLGFVMVRLIAASFYRENYLYLLDVNYHLGNTYVLLQRAFGVEFVPPTQSSLAVLTGVYDSGGLVVDPLLGGMPSSLPTVGLVPPGLSFGLVVVIPVVGIAVATYRFERMDIS